MENNQVGKIITKTTSSGKTIKFMVGDINGDGKVDEKDLEILNLLSSNDHNAEVLISMMTDEQLAACDITGDGMINREDLLEVCKKIVFHVNSNRADDKLNTLRSRIKNSS